MIEAVRFYPDVADEATTVLQLLKGKSIARFGDGELKILEGRSYTRECQNEKLTDEIRSVLTDTHPNCIIGIPTMNPDGPKYPNWLRHKRRFTTHVWSKDGRKYYSAFITRPDSAPWIESTEFCEQIRQIWARKKRVAVISEASSKLLSIVRRTHDVTHVECLRHGAYSQIDELEQRAMKVDPEVVLLSCGPTASCLANRFARLGVQGVDLGSIGGFLARWLK